MPELTSATSLTEKGGELLDDVIWLSTRFRSSREIAHDFGPSIGWNLTVVKEGGQHPFVTEIH